MNFLFNVKKTQYLCIGEEMSDLRLSDNEQIATYINIYE